jgi:HEPN domain-containing protein
MTKKEHIEYWLNRAKEDIETMNYLFKGKRYVHALFFGHLYLEKICKAVWVKNNKENHPPKIHNLLRLLSGIETGMNQDDLLFMDELEVYQLEGDTLIMQML